MSLLTMWLMGTSLISTFSHSFCDPESFSDQFVGLYFSTSYFLWNDRSLLPTFLSSLVMHNVGECPSDFYDCPFPQFTTVSFVACLCSPSVMHWLSQSNWPDGFIIWDCRPVFSVTVLGIWGSGSISVLGRVFTFQGTILSAWCADSFSGADKSELQVHSAVTLEENVSWSKQII